MPVGSDRSVGPASPEAEHQAPESGLSDDSRLLRGEGDVPLRGQPWPAGYKRPLHADGSGGAWRRRARFLAHGLWCRAFNRLCYAELVANVPV